MTPEPTTAPSPLTPDDIAAIAGYWGKDCSYEQYVTWNNKWDTVTATLDQFSIFQLVNAGDTIRNFQLHLKSLHSLTEEDLRVMAGLLGVEMQEPKLERSDPLQHLAGFTSYTDSKGTGVWIWYNGNIDVDFEGDTNTDYNPIAAIQYAMRKGYWWPNSVREGLVKIITE